MDKFLINAKKPIDNLDSNIDNKYNMGVGIII